MSDESLIELGKRIAREEAIRQQAVICTSPSELTRLMRKVKPGSIPYLYMLSKCLPRLRTKYTQTEKEVDGTLKGLGVLLKKVDPKTDYYSDDNNKKGESDNDVYEALLTEISKWQGLIEYSSEDSE